MPPSVPVEADVPFENLPPATPPAGVNGVSPTEAVEALRAGVAAAGAPEQFHGRVPPHSQESEEYLISSLLIDAADVLPRCAAAGITERSFYIEANRTVFSRATQMHAVGLQVDAATLAQEMTSNNELEPVGGLRFLLQVSSRVPTAAQAGYFIDKVRELALLRETIRSSTQTVEDAYQFTGDIHEFLSLARARLPSPDRISGKGAAYTVWQPAAFRAWTPPPNINIMGGGYLRRRQLTTLIGPPGVGKSRLSLWMACCHIAGRAFFGLDPQNSPAKWLFFGNENDPLRQKTDLHWFYNSLLAPDHAKIDANLFLHVIDKPDDGIITLADPEAWAKLVSTLRQVVPDVVVFDPWGNMIEGNENDNEEVRRTLKLLLRAINQTCPDAAILVIHHARTGKATASEAGNNYSGGSLGRGSKALVSSARCELALWPGHSEDSSRLVLTCEKANNVEKFDPKGLKFENGIYVEDGQFSVKEWKDDIDGNRGGKTLTIRDLVAIVKDGVSRNGEIVERAKDAFGSSRSTILARLNEAVTGGYLVKTMPAGSYTLGSTAV